MKTMISDLPRDLIEDILSRVPMKATRASVRLTCKNWNTISQNRSFSKMHIDKAARLEGESTMIARIDQNLYLMSVSVNDVDHPSIEVKGKLSCLEEQVKISRVFPCEGLLLCILEGDTRLVVWNPYCGKTTWIEQTPTVHCPTALYALGYEDNESCRRFKLLRFVDYIRDGRSEEKKKSWYEIYDFELDLWTTLDVTPHWCIRRWDYGVSLKGNTYWCAAEPHGRTDRIIAFDFTRERFGPFLPLPFKVKDYEYVELSGVREEKLSVLSQAYPNQYEAFKPNPCVVQIWNTTKIDVESVSWSKVFKFETIDDPTGFTFIDSYYFIDEEKKLAMGFEYNWKRFIIIGEAGYIRDMDLGVSVMEHSGLQMCSYVPSSAEIKKLGMLR